MLAFLSVYLIYSLCCLATWLGQKTVWSIAVLARTQSNISNPSKDTLYDHFKLTKSRLVSIIYVSYSGSNFPHQMVPRTPGVLPHLQLRLVHKDLAQLFSCISIHIYTLTGLYIQSRSTNTRGPSKFLLTGGIFKKALKGPNGVLIN